MSILADGGYVSSHLGVGGGPGLGAVGAWRVAQARRFPGGDVAEPISGMSAEPRVARAVPLDAHCASVRTGSPYRSASSWRLSHLSSALWFMAFGSFPAAYRGMKKSVSRLGHHLLQDSEPRRPGRDRRRNPPSPNPNPLLIACQRPFIPSQPIPSLLIINQNHCCTEVSRYAQPQETAVAHLHMVREWLWRRSCARLGCG